MIFSMQTTLIANDIVHALVIFTDQQNICQHRSYLVKHNFVAVVWTLLLKKMNEIWKHFVFAKKKVKSFCLSLLQHDTYKHF